MFFGLCCVSVPFFGFVDIWLLLLEGRMMFPEPKPQGFRWDVIISIVLWAWVIFEISLIFI